MMSAYTTLTTLNPFLHLVYVSAETRLRVREISRMWSVVCSSSIFPIPSALAWASVVIELEPMMRIPHFWNGYRPRVRYDSSLEWLMSCGWGEFRGKSLHIDVVHPSTSAPQNLYLGGSDVKVCRFSQLTHHSFNLLHQLIHHQLMIYPLEYRFEWWISFDHRLNLKINKETFNLLL